MNSSGLRSKRFIPLLVLLAFVILAYSSSLRGQFQFDDEQSILNNPQMRDVSRVLSMNWIDAIAGMGRPVTNLTFAVNYAFGRLDSSGYHWVNLIIHLGVVVLLYLLTRKTLILSGYGNADGLALIVAGIFGLHPLQSQAVSYISQRAEILASFFYLLTLLVFIRAQEEGLTGKGVVFYILGMASFLLGMGSKEIVITVPVAFVLYALLFSPGPGRDDQRERKTVRTIFTRRAVPLLFIILGIIAVVLKLRLLTGNPDVGFSAKGMTTWPYLLTQCTVVFTYLRLILFPKGLNVDYDYPVYHSLFDLPVLLSFVLLSVLFGLAVYLIYRSRRSPSTSPQPLSAVSPLRLISFGILWYFLVLSPTSSFIPIVDVIFEHRVYLASWGIILSIVVAGEMALRRIPLIDDRKKRIVAIVITAVLWCSFGFALFERNKVWQTEKSLWTDVVEKSPLNPRAHVRLGYALASEGRYEEAIGHYRRALDFPDDRRVKRFDVLRNMGNALFQEGKIDEAIAVFEEALRNNPVDVRTLNSLAICYLEKKDYDAALRYASSAYRGDPAQGGVRNTLGEIFFGRGAYEQALAHFREAVRLNPDVPAYHLNIALSLERLGRREEACGAWQRYAAIETKAADREEAVGHMKELGCVTP